MRRASRSKSFSGESGEVIVSEVVMEWLDEKAMACNLLSFQGLQAERRDSIPLRSTT